MIFQETSTMKTSQHSKYRISDETRVKMTVSETTLLSINFWGLTYRDYLTLGSWYILYQYS